MNDLPSPNGDRELGALLSIAVPLALAQLTQMIMGMTDAIWMGHIGTDALAAGGLGSSLAFMILIVTSGLVQSIQPIVAQGRGAGDESAFGRALGAGLLLSALVALPVVLLLLSADRLLIAAHDPPFIAHLTRMYETGLVWGVPAWFWQNTLRSYLSALARTRVILGVTAIGALLNFFLNWVLIFGHFGMPALGLAGSGYATAIVAWGMAIAFTLYLVGMKLLPRDLFRLSWRQVWLGISEIFAIGWPIVGVLAVEIGLFTGSMVVMAQFGPVALAAHQICMNFCSLTFMVPMGIGTAAAVRVAYHLGAGAPERARKAGSLSLLLAIGFMSIAAIGMRTFATAIFHLYLPSSDPLLPAVTALGTSLITLAALFQVFDGTQTVAAGALRGLRDTRAALLAGIAGYWILGGPFGLLLAFRFGLGPVGIWWGFTLGLVVVAILLSLRFYDRVGKLISAGPHAGVGFGWLERTDASA
jgi:MATE family multidrug resistance protein